ncbi:MAG TPA: peptidyl-prolyl cis-trans isomerase [Vicinamibacterales bacterium]|jgi:peptidyl-prolyl cis-trans isomerase SurA|nr:peptidyl-prolyl cis-trans isomerase [Vicinamibacterales bacterium]
MTYRLIAAAAGLILTGGLLTGIPLRAEVIEQVLVKVNGEIVSKSDFEQRLTSSLARPEYANAKTDFELQKAIGELTPDLILEAVDELLLIQRGRELNYSLSDAQFKEILENIKKQNNLTEEAQFQAALKQEGMTLADLRRNIERSMMISQVQSAEVTQKLSATEEEAREYFEAHRSDFTTPSEVMLREILIEVPATDRGVSVAQDEEAKAKAEDVRQRLLKGEPFPRLAAEVSSSASKANGGLIGPIHMDELAPQLQQLLGKLKVGEIADVIRTTRGYQILKIESRTEVKSRTFEEARNDIGRRVIDGKSRAALQKYLDELRAQADIKWRNPELERAYDQALAKRRQQAGVVAKPAA